MLNAGDITAVQYGLRSVEHVEKCRSRLDICSIQLFLFKAQADRRRAHFRKRVPVDRVGARKCSHDTIIDHGQRIAAVNIIEGYGESLHIFAMFILPISTLRQGLWLAIEVPESDLVQIGFPVPRPSNLGSLVTRAPSSDL